MFYVLRFKNKSGDFRYFNKEVNNYGVLYDCDTIASAHKLTSKIAANDLCGLLNDLNKKRGYYGKYKVIAINK